MCHTLECTRDRGGCTECNIVAGPANPPAVPCLHRSAAACSDGISHEHCSTKMPCQFCGYDLSSICASEQVGLDQVFRCPRCGVVAMLTTDPEGARQVLTGVVLGRDNAFAKNALRDIRVVPDVNIILGEPGGLEERRVCLVVAWDPLEQLTTRQVADILGLTQRWISHSAQRGRFPGAFRAAPKTRRAQCGHWLIPRHALLSYLSRRAAKSRNPRRTSSTHSNP